MDSGPDEREHTPALPVSGPRASPATSPPGAGRPDATGESVVPPLPPPGAGLRVNRNLAVPLSEITWRATTPGGPGGQHANRTASRVEVRFDVNASRVLGPRQRALLLERVGPVVTASASDDRSQVRNRQLALDRLAARLADALRVAPGRRPTTPTAGSRTRRLDAKRRRGNIKRGRRTGAADDE
jgi:ribosome-associated protein